MPHHYTGGEGMSEKDQIEHLAQSLKALINRFRSEYEMSLASVIGVLEVEKHELIAEQLKDS